MNNESVNTRVDFIDAVLALIGIFFFSCALFLAVTALPKDFVPSTLYYIVASGGVVLALSTYLANRRRARREYREKMIQRQNEIYRAIDDKYFVYLRYCLENVELDVYDIPNDRIPYSPKAEPDKKKELIAYTMLISMMEIAFIEYLSAPEEIKENQEYAWHEYIQRFATRENFQSAWRIWNENDSFLFDRRFVKYMRDLMKDRELGQKQ